MIYYGIIISLFWLGLLIYLSVNDRKISFLRDTIINQSDFPPISIVVAVRNEGTVLAAALETLCNISYPDYELIIINDRSTDNSAAILSTFENSHKNLQIVTITGLPEKWLGKNHALYAGYLKSKYDWILFSDADIHFAPQSLQKAMQYTIDHKLDHLTLLPEVYNSSTWLASIMSTFQVLLDLKLRPWNARNKRSKASLGVGAFNLVRKEAYEAIGTHKAISLRPDDDLKLGERLKHAGFNQDVCYADGEVSLEWYENVKALINGMMKNSFAAADYNVFMCIGGVIWLLLFFVVPVPVLLLFGNTTERMMAIAALIFQLILFTTKPAMRATFFQALLMPYAAFMMCYIITKATWLTLTQKGIYWRDTFYSLKELKQQR
jgi:cellulose synthase/poly-beta-1,6-N-acetylglucosamine synthase-like glycosyltransferase